LLRSSRCSRKGCLRNAVSSSVDRKDYTLAPAPLRLRTHGCQSWQKTNWHLRWRSRCISVAGSKTAAGSACWAASPPQLLECPSTVVTRHVRVTGRCRIAISGEVWAGRLPQLLRRQRRRGIKRLQEPAVPGDRDCVTLPGSLSDLERLLDRMVCRAALGVWTSSGSQHCQGRREQAASEMCRFLWGVCTRRLQNDQKASSSRQYMD